MNPIWWVFLLGLFIGAFGQWIFAVAYLNPWLAVAIIAVIFITTLKGERA